MPRNPQQRQRHVAVRAKQRYGLDLDSDQVRQLEQGIADRSLPVTFLNRTREGTRHLRVEFQGKDIKVIYDPRHESVVTVLPPRSHSRKR